MDHQQFNIDDLDNMQLEELTDLWEKGKLSAEMKDHVITRVPLLRYVRKWEIETNNGENCIAKPSIT